MTASRRSSSCESSASGSASPRTGSRPAPRRQGARVEADRRRARPPPRRGTAGSPALRGWSGRVGRSLRAAAAEGLGQLAFRAGDFKGAIRRFEEALAVSASRRATGPGSRRAWGAPTCGLGELAPAISIFEQCLRACERREPIQTVRFACLLGYALIDNGDLSRAEQFSRARSQKARTRPIRSRAPGSTSRSRASSRSARHVRACATAAWRSRRSSRPRTCTSAPSRTSCSPTSRSTEIGSSRPSSISARAGRSSRRAALRWSSPTSGSRRRARWPASVEGGGGEPRDADLERARRRDAGGRGRTYTLLADVVELGEPERAQELYELAVEYLKPANPSRYVADVYAKLASLHESEGRRDRA